MKHLVTRDLRGTRVKKWEMRKGRGQLDGWYSFTRVFAEGGMAILWTFSTSQEDWYVASSTAEILACPGLATLVS
jgi:hypothetical protein